MAETVGSESATVNGAEDDAGLNGGGIEYRDAFKNRADSDSDNNPSGCIKSSKRKFDEIEVEEFVGFTSPINNTSKKQLTSLIEKLEQQLQNSEIISKKISTKLSKQSLPSGSAEEISRPSSGLSHRSDSDATVGTDESPIPTTTRHVSRKSSVDLSSPLYRIPFDHGWKRELVFRSSSDQMKKQADVYYYAPNGKKLRSTREVLEHIHGTGLTVDNFTFYKDPLGVDDPDKEIIRGAKLKTSTGDSTGMYDKTVPSPTGNQTVEGKRTPKPKGPKGSSPDRFLGKSGPLKVKSVGSRLSTSSLSDKVSSPDHDSTLHKKTPGRKPSLSGTPVIKKNILSISSPSLSVSMIHSSDIASQNEDNLYPEIQDSSPPSTAFSTIETLSQSTHLTESQLPSQDNETTFFNSEVSIQKLPSSTTVSQAYEQPVETPKGSLQPCSMRCPLALGEIPTLQCGLCLCLYHNQCAGVQSSNIKQYVCLNCQAATSMQFSPPGKQLTKSTPQGSSTPIVQSRPTPPRIPQPGLIPVSKHAKMASGSIISKAATKLSKINDRQHHGKCIDGIISQGPPPPKKAHKKESEKTGKSILGSVTPRLPSSTSIQMIPKPPQKLNHPVIDPCAHQPQMIGIYHGKKYIVVPKHNTLNAVLSMSNASNSVPKQAESAPKLNELTYSIYNAGNDKSQKDIRRDGDMTPVDPTSIEAVKEAIQQYNESLSESKSNVSSGDEVKKRGRPPKSGKGENGTLDQKGRPNKQPKEIDQKDYFTDFYVANQAQGYDSLIQIFQYLKMRELAHAARVCRLWRDIAATPALWRSVRMKNSQVNDWEGLTAALKRHGTKHLDLRKMLLPSEVPQKTWDQITEYISTVNTLTRIDLCRCTASVVEKICAGLPKLEALTSNSLRCQVLDPSPLALLADLKELRIKGMNGLTLSSDLKCLENLKKLKHLSLTSIRDLDKCGGCSWLSSLTELEWLELGEFVVDGQEAADALSKLTNLTRLRLERSPVDGPVVLRAISKLERLTHLELINFDIKVGFESAIGLCTNIKRFLIIPTYVSQSATTNRCILDGVLRLKSTLNQLVWGITIELTRVTELFIDQCNRSSDSGVGGSPKKKVKNKTHTEDCIPVLKPVPGLLGQDIKATPPGGPPQVEILPIPTLERLLASELPDTKLTILRIPFHATWRQLLNDND